MVRFYKVQIHLKKCMNVKLKFKDADTNAK